MSTDRTNPQYALIDAISVHGSIVHSSGYELDDLASAAAALGQDRLAKRLAYIAQSLNESYDLMRSAHGAAIHDNLVQAEQATSNMMRGVLAGIGLGAGK